jgi:hypothetical protein
MKLLMINYVFLLVVANYPCLALLNHYLKMSMTDAVGHDIVHVECGEGRNKHLSIIICSHRSYHLGYDKPCDIEELAARCNTNPSCYGFNSNGLLKSCTAGCDMGCCYDVAEHVDLYIRQGYLPPNDWQDKIERGQMLFANPEPHFCFLPEIANGYLGSVAMSASLFQSGLFNGKVDLLAIFSIRYLGLLSMDSSVVI